MLLPVVARHRDHVDVVGLGGAPPEVAAVGELALELGHVLVAEVDQAGHGRAGPLDVLHPDHQVDHRLGRQAGHGRAADVLDGQGGVADGGGDPVALVGVGARPVRVVVDHLDGLGPAGGKVNPPAWPRCPRRPGAGTGPRPAPPWPPAAARPRPGPGQPGRGQLPGGAERRPQRRRRPGQPGGGEQGGDPQRLGPGVQGGVEGQVLAGLGQVPGLALRQVGVGGADEPPDGGQGPLVGDLLEGGGGLGVGPPGGLLDGDLGVGGRPGPGQHPVAVALDHGRDPAGQVAEPVGQVGVVALDQRLPGEVAVLAEGDLALEEVADGVAAERLHQVVGGDAGELGLAHLLAPDQQPAVGLDGAGQGQAGREQDGRPGDGVEAEDVLAHEVVVGRPHPANRSMSASQPAAVR